MIKLKHLVENSTEIAYTPLTREEKVKLISNVNLLRDIYNFQHFTPKVIAGFEHPSPHRTCSSGHITVKFG